MRVDLTSEEIQKIVGFAGYGRPDAPVWFLGLEEGLGDMSSAEAIKNLKERLRFDEVMDLRCAHHKRLWENGSPIDWGVSGQTKQFPNESLVWGELRNKNCLTL
jgi:hypothetical protein